MSVLVDLPEAAIERYVKEYGYPEVVLVIAGRGRKGAVPEAVRSRSLVMEHDPAEDVVSGRILCDLIVCHDSPVSHDLERHLARGGRLLTDRTSADAALRSARLKLVGSMRVARQPGRNSSLIYKEAASSSCIAHTAGAPLFYVFEKT